MITLRSLRLVVPLVAVMGFFGCTDLKRDLPLPTAGTVDVHGDGWVKAAHPNFHGKAIQKANWDMSLCQTCHGSAYDGGTSKVSCLTCHTGTAGPENCTTCHGSANPAPPRDIAGDTLRSSPGVGAHQKHLAGAIIAATLICSDCHLVPAKLKSPGHVDSPLPAEVVINSPLARTVTNEPTTNFYDSSLPLVQPAPIFHYDSLSCANTYCHGDFKNGNAWFRPVWNDTTGTQAACGTCHGSVDSVKYPTLAGRALPRDRAGNLLGGHDSSFEDCSGCHDDIDSNLKFISPSQHINGKLNVYGGEEDF